MPLVRKAIKKNFVVTAGLIGLGCAALAFFTEGGTLGSGYAEAKAMILQGSPEYLATLPAEEQSHAASAMERVTPLYFLWRALATFLVLLTAIPGGLFDPSFSVGAGLGHTLYEPLLAWTGAPQQAVLLLFIVAYFSGVVQSPMTSFIILLEMTGVTMFALPLALTAILAYEISKLICPTALYEALAFSFLKANEAVNPLGEPPVAAKEPGK